MCVWSTTKRIFSTHHWRMKDHLYVKEERLFCCKNWSIHVSGWLLPNTFSLWSCFLIFSLTLGSFAHVEWPTTHIENPKHLLLCSWWDRPQPISCLWHNDTYAYKQIVCVTNEHQELYLLRWLKSACRNSITFTTKHP